MSSSPDRPTSIPNVVLLGDSLGTMPSISDRGPGMLEKQLLPDIDEPWRLTIIRADDVINHSPLAEFPAGASHVVISVEGNRAIQSSHLLEGHPDSYESALARLSFAADQFEGVMDALVRAACRTSLPTLVCTMYQPRYPNPVRQRAASAALAIFNDRIIKLAVEARLPIVDFRSVCTEPGDYGEEGLLSRAGLAKLAAVIWRALHEITDRSTSNGTGTEIFR